MINKQGTKNKSYTVLTKYCKRILLSLRVRYLKFCTTKNKRNRPSKERNLIMYN